ncbi:MAG: TetR/AcrR family transcriptional regulator C-terminal domain-containing protein [Solobacterium sp.]|nr:TetR/AcrR family transcriptional regulator C-terminal domain-containing protein [Solobacterium sp.]
MLRQLFEKITIKQICDQAGVIRATFYNYFEDKYDCLNTIVRLDFERILKNSTSHDSAEIVRDILATIDENREFYRVAYSVVGQNSFEDMVRMNLARSLTEYFVDHRRPAVIEQYTNEFLGRYYAESLAFHIREYVFRKENTKDTHEVARNILELLSVSLTDLLD